MRYAKGTLAVNSDRDIPLLLQVRNSKFISHQQLFTFLQFASLEHSRNSFNWRISRLLQSKYLSFCSGQFGRGTVIYSVTTAGLLQLEDHGHFASVLNSKSQRLPDASLVHHSLELNEIHLALMRAQLLVRWQSDVETASANTVARIPLEKDYDAVVDVWNGAELARFAVEYERTLKSARRYEQIRSVLSQEGRIGCVLYLTSGTELARYLADELCGCPKRLAFTTAPDFRQQLLDTPVTTHPRQPQVAFRQLLRGLF